MRDPLPWTYSWYGANNLADYICILIENFGTIHQFANAEIVSFVTIMAQNLHFPVLKNMQLYLKLIPFIHLWVNVFHITFDWNPFISL